MSQDDKKKGLPETSEPPADENQIIAERRGKLKALRAQGSAYPNDFRRDALSADLHQAHDAKTAEEIDAAPTRVAVAGRMLLKRVMGKASFATLQDMSGRIQLYVTNDHAGTETHEAFKHWDLGDIVGARGVLFKTRTGELTVKVTELRLLSKALRPLPEKFHGLTDQEQKYRQRYVDLITSPESRRVFVARSQIVQSMREFFVARGYLEVETPMMHPIPGGAAARPFVTHHNTLDMDLYLRIAPELYLKRLTVGGFDRVYEINRNFRNEGLGWRWNPEFTMLEAYQAYTDYLGILDTTQGAIEQAVKDVTGGMKTKWGEHEIDWSHSNWRRMTMREAIVHFWPETAGAKPERSDFAARESVEALVGRVRGAGISLKYDAAAPVGKTIAAIFEAVVEEHLMQPTIIYEFPTAVSPLSKQKPDEPDWTERFELFAGKMEIANGFSELNDPEDQRRRFESQLRERERGDEEAHQMDENYI